MAELSIDTSGKPLFKQLLDSPFATIIASVLSTFIIAAAFFKLSGPVPFSIQQTSVEKQSTFDVTGEGSATAIPNVAQVNLGITINKPSVSAAQEEANQVINSITKSLKDNGVKDENIKTQNYSVNPQYDFRNSGRTLIGYTVSANLRVKITDFAKLNQAIDSAVSLGANQVGGITFTLSDQSREQAEEQARIEAVAKAKQKAQSLSRAAGVKLGRIVNIQENAFRQPPPIFRSLEATAIDEGPDREPTQIQPGSTEVNLTVTLSYETL